MTNEGQQQPFSTANAAFADLYPERRGPGITYSIFDKMAGRAKATSTKEICQNNILNCLEMPMIKLMLSALESSGCKVDLNRHLSCEICTSGSDCQNMGGYDEETNQVFVCANNAGKVGSVHGVLLRNLLHMFDACTRFVNAPRPLFLNIREK